MRALLILSPSTFNQRRRRRGEGEEKERRRRGEGEEKERGRRGGQGR